MATHSNVQFVLIFSLENFFLPIQINFVLLVFIFRPDTDPNISIVLSADNNDLSEPSKIIVVSSANCVILYSSEPTWTPLMSLFLYIRLHRICAQIINRYGAVGSPCLHPL